MANGLVELINYLIPSATTPRGYVQSAVFSLTPVVIDFRGVSGSSFDGQGFHPSGVFIDNSQGTSDLVITIVELGFNLSCPAGKWSNLQFPAPINFTASIVGGGQATMLFVDFPVMPFSQAVASGPASVAWGAITGVLSDQGDLQAALTNAGNTAQWGNIAGTLSAQSDLNSALFNASHPAWGNITGAITDQGDLQGQFNSIRPYLTDILNTNGQLAAFIAGNIQALSIGSNGQILGVVAGEPAWISPTLINYTVAGLPGTAGVGDVAYATNGRKVGEGAGAGTGVPVYFSGSAWHVYSTDAVVSA